MPETKLGQEGNNDIFKEHTEEITLQHRRIKEVKAVWQMKRERQCSASKQINEVSQNIREFKAH